MSDEKYEKAISLLKSKYEEIGRLPLKADFDPNTVCFIKQKLGPWSRALEAAELKPPQKITAKEKSRIKRQRAKQRRKAMKKLNNSDCAV